MIVARAVRTLEYKSLIAVVGDVVTSPMMAGKTAIRREFAIITSGLHPTTPAICVDDGADCSGIDSLRQSLKNLAVAWRSPALDRHLK